MAKKNAINSTLDSLTLTEDNSVIVTDTLNGADSKRLGVSAGGIEGGFVSGGRSAILELYGNEYNTSASGNARLAAGVGGGILQLETIDIQPIEFYTAQNLRWQLASTNNDFIYSAGARLRPESGVTNQFLTLNGGAAGPGEGARLMVFGNTHAFTGQVRLEAGNVSGGDIVFQTMGVERWNMADSDGTLLGLQSDNFIGTNTTISGDDSSMTLMAADDIDLDRTGSVRVYGNEAASRPGDVWLFSSRNAAAGFHFYVGNIDEEVVRIDSSGRTVRTNNRGLFWMNTANDTEIPILTHNNFNNTVLNAPAGQYIYFNKDNSITWSFNPSNALQPATSGTYDVGTASNPIGTLYATSISGVSLGGEAFPLDNEEYVSFRNNLDNATINVLTVTSGDDTLLTADNGQEIQLDTTNKVRITTGGTGELEFLTETGTTTLRLFPDTTGDSTIQLRTQAADYFNIGEGPAAANSYIRLYGANSSFTSDRSSLVLHTANNNGNAHIKFSPNDTERWRMEWNGGHLVPQTAGVNIGSSSLPVGDLFTGSVILTDNPGSVIANTVSGSDNFSIGINGAGQDTSLRGGGLRAYGNQHAAEPGRVYVTGGNIPTGDVVLRTTNANSTINFRTDDIARWTVDSGGDYSPEADDTYSIGSAGAKVSDIYVSNVRGGSENNTLTLEATGTGEIHFDTAGSQRVRIEDNQFGPFHIVSAAQTGVGAPVSQIHLPDTVGNRGGYGVSTVSGGGLAGMTAQVVTGGVFPNTEGLLDLWYQEGGSTQRILRGSQADGVALYVDSVKRFTLEPDRRITHKGHNNFSNSEYQRETIGYECTISGAETAWTFTPVNNGAAWVTARLSAYDAPNDESFWIELKSGVRRHNSGSAALIGTVVKTSDKDQAATWDATFDTSGNDLRLRVTAVSGVVFTGTIEYQQSSGAA